MDNKKERKRKYKQEQLNAFEKSLPFDKILFERLFDYLDKMLENGCDDTLKYTELFLKENNLPTEISLHWMKENGGYCDCEVLANIEEKILESE